MPKMISLTDHPFDGLSLRPGDKFDAGHEYVEFLIVTGRARVATASDDVPTEVATTSGRVRKDITATTTDGYETREMTPVPDTAESQVTVPPTAGKRTYQRKAAQ